MAVIRNLLNNGLAEVDDELAKSLIDSGTWVSDKAPVKKRVHAVKPAVEPGE